MKRHLWRLTQPPYHFQAINACVPSSVIPSEVEGSRGCYLKAFATGSLVSEPDWRFARDDGLRSIFVEASVDQCFDFFERALGIGSFTTNLQFRSLSCRQHHQAHDALAIYFFALLFHPHFGAKATRHFNEKGCRPGMQTEAVHDCDFLLGFLRGGAGTSFSIKQSHRDFSSPLN